MQIYNTGINPKRSIDAWHMLFKDSWNMMWSCAIYLGKIMDIQTLYLDAQTMIKVLMIMKMSQYSLTICLCIWGNPCHTFLKNPHNKTKTYYVPG